jgi:hypothetical protein
LIRALAERGVSFFDFRPIEASLESAFWNLAEPRARESRVA